MNISSFLEKHEPILYQSLTKSFSSHEIPHAYLLSGESGTPLKETAFFIAKSLLCDHPLPLADETCRTCERVDHLTYSDMDFLNGEEGTIKKEDVANLIDNFSKTPNEEKGIKVYVIHQVENMTPESVNSLLKFLEEPPLNTYAILTSNNVTKVLPTIVSRCESLRLLLIPRTEVISESTSKGLVLGDAEILSYFCNSSSIIAEEIQSESYLNAKAAFEAALEGLAHNKDEAVYAFEDTVSGLCGKKEGARYFLDMLSLAYKDILSLQTGCPIILSSYATLITPLSKKVVNASDDLYLIMKARGELDLNINVPLLLAHLAINLTKEF